MTDSAQLVPNSTNSYRFGPKCSINEIWALPKAFFHMRYNTKIIYIKSLFHSSLAILFYVHMVLGNSMPTSNKMNKQWIIIQRVSKYSI